jgi:hypothetical protein
MGRISKKIKIDMVPGEVFQKFVNEFNEWWPNEYTWSQKTMHEIIIGTKKNGLCSEIGPYGFRCDWGRITDIEEGVFIELKWQVGPKREPVPNTDKASDVMIEFTEDIPGTLLILQHFNFGNHGENSAIYRDVMDSNKGWGYILKCFKSYCENMGNLVEGQNERMD